MSERRPARLHGPEQLVFMAISIGVSLLAQKLLKPKNRSPIDDDKPTTLTTRGSYLNWLIGIREVGPCVAWAGDRVKRKEKIPGGKGFASPKQDVWYEAGWHQLASHECRALHRIEQSGKVIFEGPITQDSHPSGSTIDLGGEGAFTIYWGEIDQPINAFLGDAARVSISSRWPGCCYVVWNKKRLGSTPVWPILNYVLESRPTGAFLTQSDSWYEPTRTLDGVTATVVDFVASADPDAGYLEVVGDLTQEFDPGRAVAVSGNGLSDGDYTVLRTEAVQVVVGASPGFGNVIYETRTRVAFTGGTLGADDMGTVQAYTYATDDGANIAHVVADMLFAQWPRGLGLDPDGPEPWDLESLEAWGVEAETLGLRASIVGVNGETVEALLGAALQDHGVFLAIDTLNRGLLSFRRIREPSGVLPLIPADLFSGGPPQRETKHGEPAVDKLIFKFTDRDHGFGDMTIAEKDDGQIGYVEYARSREVPIVTTVHFDTASVLASQRSQEELGGAAGFTIQVSRGARELLPGDAVEVEDFEEVLRVWEVGVDPLTEETTIKVVPDSYGIPRTDYEDVPGGGTFEVLEPEADLFRPVEVPEALLSGQEVLRLMVPRIRAHAQTIEALQHFSADDSTYTLVGVEPGAAFGGALVADLSETAAYYQAQGPIFASVGPDAAATLDLTGDDVSWSRGRQLAIFAGDDGVEICFVRKVTAVGGGQYRLDGLQRARYDTRRVEWPTGTEVYVFADDELQVFDDVLLVPGDDLFLKSQPVASGGSIPLSAVAPKNVELYGKGLVPVTPEALYVSAPAKGSPSYVASADVTVRWGWSTSSSQQTGAGYQAAGSAIGDPEIKGSFLVQLRTSGGTLVSEQTLAVPEVTYSAATLAASPISGGDFRVRVLHVNNGFSSPHAELLVTKV